MTYCTTVLTVSKLTVMCKKGGAPFYSKYTVLLNSLNVGLTSSTERLVDFHEDWQVHTTVYPKIIQAKM